MKKDRKKGIFLLEAVISLGIFAVFMSFTLPFVKQSLQIKNTVRKELRYNRNFIYVIENIRQEAENFKEINILSDGKGIEGIQEIYQNGKYKKIKTVYKFTGSMYGSQLIRYVVVNGEKFKDDIVFEKVNGKFFEEDGFIKLKIAYKISKEEEYIWK